MVNPINANHKPHKPNWRWFIIESTAWEMLTGFDATSVTLNTQCSEHCSLALTFGGSNCDDLVRIREDGIQISTCH